MISPPNLSRAPLGEWGLLGLDQLNLEGLESWTGEQQQLAKDLLVDSAEVFAKSDLDLGKCNIIKHGHQNYRPPAL